MSKDEEMHGPADWELAHELSVIWGDKAFAICIGKSYEAECDGNEEKAKSWWGLAAIIDPAQAQHWTHNRCYRDCTNSIPKDHRRRRLSLLRL